MFRRCTIESWCPQALESAFPQTRYLASDYVYIAHIIYNQAQDYIIYPKDRWWLTPLKSGFITFDPQFMLSLAVPIKYKCHFLIGTSRASI